MQQPVTPGWQSKPVVTRIKIGFGDTKTPLTLSGSDGAYMVHTMSQSPPVRLQTTFCTPAAYHAAYVPHAPPPAIHHIAQQAAINDRQAVATERPVDAVPHASAPVIDHMAEQAVAPNDLLTLYLTPLLP
jgi:hypothetical protein